MVSFKVKAQELHNQAVVMDTHSHFLINGHYLRKDFGKLHTPPRFFNPLRNYLDLPRLRSGGVSCSTFAVYVPPWPLRLSAWKACLRILDTFDRLVQRHAEHVVKVETADEIRAAHRLGKLGAALSVEGGHVIGWRLDRLALLRERGVRMLTLTHFVTNLLCDAYLGPRIHGGLSQLGRRAIAECQRVGIAVDLAHATEAAFFQALDLLQRPPMVTHTAPRLGRASDRYLSDEQLKALAALDGVVGVIFFPWYLEPWGVRGSLDRIVDVYARLADLIGTRHLMIGTDMDGYVWLPRGLRDVADLPRLTEQLLKRGFAEEEVIGILGQNALRVLSAWEG